MRLKKGGWSCRAAMMRWHSKAKQMGDKTKAGTPLNAMLRSISVYASLILSPELLLDLAHLDIVIGQ